MWFVLVLGLSMTCQPASAARQGGTFRPAPCATVPIARPARVATAATRSTSGTLLALADCAVAARGAWVAPSGSGTPPRQLRLLDELFGPLDRAEWLEDEEERPRLCWFRRRPRPGDGMATRCAGSGYSLRKGRVGRVETRHVHAPLLDGRRPGFAAVHLGDEIWLSSWSPTAKITGVRTLLDSCRHRLLDESGNPLLPARNLVEGERRRVVDRPRLIALWAAACYDGDLSPFLRIRRQFLSLRPDASAADRVHVEFVVDAATEEDARLLVALCRLRDAGRRRIDLEGTRVHLALSLPCSPIDTGLLGDETLLQERLLP